MAKKLQAIRGMNDLLPESSPVWQYLEGVVKNVLAEYGYREIRFPIVESTELFKRSIGEVTDIVEKEMYTFDDRNGDSLTLRPEGTACCVRAAEQSGLLFNQTQRLWYAGPMFRHERPQKGRYRQFHQIGVECFGMASADIDAEVIALSASLWEKLGISDVVTLQINSLGLPQERAEYRVALVEYLKKNIDALDEDSKRRLETNPLRVLDSKSASTQAVLVDAPKLEAYLGEESKEHFEQLKQFLDTLGVAYEVNPNLVRGLDYYSKTVFEWVTDALGAQGTVCAGGRYDGLVEQLGGKATPGVGFAMGVERLVLLLEELGKIPEEVHKTVDVFIATMGVNAQHTGFKLARLVRERLNLKVLHNMGGGSFKSQFKKADKSGASVALVLGEDELERGEVIVKPLLGQGEQQSCKLIEMDRVLANFFKRA